jgi:sigma-B regulation protein RsbU (phosphoserine phosphatase)
LGAIAASIAELEIETRARAAAEAALRSHRAADAAGELGTDARALAKGRRQQRSLVSLVPPEVRGYDLASHYAAAREIGGDFFELFRLPRRGRPLGIVIADVTGKGLDAALLMAFSRPVMHSALNAARGPADALARTNKVLVGERRGTLFITALCAILEPRSGRLRVANAGHEPPWLIPADGGPVREVGASGVLMGAFEAIEPPEAEMVLEPGDILLCYTDGVTDVVGMSGERFGEERLRAVVEGARGASADDLVAGIRDAIAAFQGANEAADDVTVVAVGRHRPGRRRRGDR